MTPNAEPLAALCACPLFQGQPALAKSALADPRCTEHRYEAGEFLCTEERFARALAVIVAGECEVTKRTPSGRRMPISRLEPGMLYGAAALFTAPARYEVRLRALTPLWAVFFPEALLTDLFLAHGELALAYIRYLSGRIHFLQRRIDALAEGPAEEKLASFLLSAARPDGKNGWVFEAPSLTRLASSLSVGRATLYRALDAFEQSGVIQREGRLLRIPDITRLNPAEGMGRP